MCRLADGLPPEISHEPRLGGCKVLLLAVLGLGLLAGEAGGARPSSGLPGETSSSAASVKGHLFREEQQGRDPHGGLHRRPRVARRNATAFAVAELRAAAEYRVAGIGGSGSRARIREVDGLWEDEKHPKVYLFSRFCHDTFPVTTLHAPDHVPKCHKACPFLAPLEEGNGILSCHFKCVMATECGSGTLDKFADVPDNNEKVCRRCYIPGCAKCDVTAGYDLCQRCNIGYNLMHGACHSVGQTILHRIVFAAVLLFVVLVLWCTDLGWLRTPCNQRGLDHGLAHRDRTKLKKVDEEDPTVHKSHSLWTNFLRPSNSTVAGPGMVLYFNFMLFSIIWPAVVALGWWLIGSQVGDSYFFQIGTDPDATHAEACGAIHWGKKKMFDFEDHFLLFLRLLYIVNFLACVAFAAYQQWCFNKMQDAVTPCDYVARVSGLCLRSGRREAEVDVKRFLEQACGEELVGVSLAWSIAAQRDEVNEIMEAELRRLMEANLRARSSLDSLVLPGSAEFVDYTRNFGCLRRFMATVESSLLEAYVGMEVEGKWEEEEEILEFLGDLRTTEIAFAVFHSEASRDAAVAKCKASNGFDEPGVKSARKVHLAPAGSSPRTVLWRNFIEKPHKRRTGRIVKAAVGIFLMQVLWGVCFYMPYIYFIGAFSYAHGETPSFWSGMVFSMVVVLGNQMNYLVCALAAQYCEFTFSDQQEAWYTVSYTLANFINVAVDIATTGYLSWKILMGVGITLPDGSRLENMTSLHDIIECFPMQKILGAQLWLYNFPSTFAIPYLVEPVATITIPYQMMRLLVRACPLITSRRAEVAMEIFIPMDLGRYADIVVNITLCIIAVFFAQGFILRTLVACAVFHAWLYVYDHYRTLRCIPDFEIASDFVDRCGQAMWALPSALILVAIVFKGNCTGGNNEPGPHCKRDYDMWSRCGLAFVGHIFLHLLVVNWLVPRVMEAPFKQADVGFGECAKRNPCTHFTSNPVHCLRSKYVYKHDPPCSYHYIGKVQFMEANPDIGCYFTHLKSEARKD